MPTTGSPVSRMFVHPYCGAVGVSHGSTKLFTNGSSPHSAISWLSAWMSCSAQAEFGLKRPGRTYEAHENVCTGALPLLCPEPFVWLGTLPAPWKPITQQTNGLLKR